MTFRCPTAVSRFITRNIHIRLSRPCKKIQGARSLNLPLNHIVNLFYGTLEKTKWTAISLKLDKNEG